MHPLFNVRGHAPDRVVRLSAKRLLGVRVVGRRGRRPEHARPVVDDTPHAEQEAEAAFKARVAPLDVFFRRRHEHHVEPQRVGAVFLEHRVGIDDVALRLRHDVAVLEHHPLREQALERLVKRHQADVTQDAREEPRVEQVQDRVLDAAAVEVDRHPVRRSRRIEGQFGVLRVAEPQEVPGRIDERVHRVGFPPGRAAAGRTRGLHELRHVRERRIAPPGERLDVRQDHGQLVVRHADDAVLRAVDDRDGRSPVALTRDPPVLQPELDLASADLPGLSVRNHACLDRR